MFVLKLESDGWQQVVPDAGAEAANECWWKAWWVDGVAEEQRPHQLRMQNCLQRRPDYQMDDQHQAQAVGGMEWLRPAQTGS